MIIDTFSLYEAGIKEAVLSLEQSDPDYSLEKICQITSRYLNNKAPKEVWPMVVGIGASKGGVGKSTIAINLSHAFARAGLTTGLVDTDLSDPNDALYVNKDTYDLMVNQDETITFNRGNLIDVVFGRKVEEQRAYQKKSMQDVAVQSKTKPNLRYFLLEQLGDCYGQRGNSEKAKRLVRSTLLKKAKELEGYHVVILDFPAGTPEHLSAYIGCDERGYVVDFGNDASLSGIFNIARLVAKRKIDGNNFLFVNYISEFAGRQRIQDKLALVSSKLEKIMEKIGDDDDMRKAREIVHDTNRHLEQIGSKKLAFDRRPALLRNLEVIKESTHEGMPYLAGLSKREERSFSYSREMFTLATNMLNSYLGKNGVHTE